MEKKISTRDPVKSKELRSAKLLCIMWWILAWMFWLNIIVSVIGIATGHLDMQPIAFGFSFIVATLFTGLAIKKHKDIKELK